MPSLMNIFNIASSAMSAQSQRLNVTASNLANADSTTGPDGKPYKAKQVVFAVNPIGGARTGSGQQVGGVQVTGVIDDPTPMKTSYDPGNPAADATGTVKYPNVNPLVEMTDMRDAQRSYEANLNVVGATRNMIQRTLDILRNS